MTAQIDEKSLKKARDDSVSANIKVLENFYSFVISFALTQATMKFIDTCISSGSNVDIYGELALYISILILIVPFYQGMNRFLYDTHVVRPIKKPNDPTSPILLDIYAFLLMSILIFSLGRFLDDPRVFFFIWSSLLFVDIIWSITVWKIQGGRKNPIWAWNNLTFLIVSWAIWIAFYHFSIKFPYSDYVFVILNVARTLNDYKQNWSFYFPPEFRGAAPDETTKVAEIIYLAGPYSNDAPENPDVAASSEKRLARFNAITEAARHYVEKGNIVYSPLTMTHPIDLRMTNRLSSDFWVSFDEAFMEHCSRIIVLDLPGWDKSNGISREIEFFRNKGIEAEHISPQFLQIDQSQEQYRAAFS
ncbi:DUF1937 family protein [Nitrospirillum amazonense]|uniref:DUF1937 family protein n=1 Tax=Nitrospirillum amazonense TaxID=28077 RepID=UPI002DD421B9|nr:DUF1937 family protein [Nitrospirillum amazonense]MEC4591908.1 DUF1937 family protein [Nitrospirillum amazonense]